MCADLAVIRKNSADGWTRKIDLQVTLNDPVPWEVNKSLIEREC